MWLCLHTILLLLFGRGTLTTFVLPSQLTKIRIYMTTWPKHPVWKWVRGGAFLFWTLRLDYPPSWCWLVHHCLRKVTRMEKYLDSSPIIPQAQSRSCSDFALQSRKHLFLPARVKVGLIDKASGAQSNSSQVSPSPPGDLLAVNRPKATVVLRVCMACIADNTENSDTTWNL